MLVVACDQPRLQAVVHALEHEDAGSLAPLDSTWRPLTLAREPVDVVLLDLNLPDSTGVCTVQRLNRHAPGIPIVAIVDDTEGEAVGRILQEGAQDVLARDRLEPSLVAQVLDTAVARHRAGTSLREREARLSAAFAGTNDGLWDWDLCANNVFYSSHWNAILGLPEKDVEDGPEHWFDRVHRDDRPGLQLLLEAHLQGESRHFEHEHRVLHTRR